MSNKILVKRSAVQAKVPTVADLDLGEFAVNTYDGKIYIKKDDGAESIVEITDTDIHVVNLSSDFSAVENNTLYVVDTAGAALATGAVNFTITLPASPVDNEFVRIVDGNGNAQDRPILVARNAKNIDGTADDLTCDVNYFDIKLIYVAADNNWVIGGK